MLEPSDWSGAVVCGFGSKGKKGFLDTRKTEIAGLLDAKISVCLVDVPGTGESSFGDGRGKSTANTSYSSTAQMLGKTLDAPRLAGLLLAIGYAENVATKTGRTARIGLWGDTDAAVNPPTAKLEVPHDVEPYPAIADPLGARLALEVGQMLDMRAVFARGGIADMRTVFASPFLYVPHDAIAVPVDVESVRATLAKKGTALRLDRFVDARNRAVPTVGGEPAETEVVAWFVKALR